MPKINFMQTAEEGRKRKSGSRHDRRVMYAEALALAKKEGAGMSVPALKKLIRRKFAEKGL